MIAAFDTEFIQEGNEFFSIGIAREDGVRLHLISAEANTSKAGWWFKKNVLKLVKSDPRHPLSEIRARVQDICRGVDMLITRSGENDALMLKRLGVEIPIFDIQTTWQDMGCPKLPTRTSPQHHALHDAEWHMALFDALLRPTTILACLNTEIAPRNGKALKRFNQMRARVHELEFGICT